jgi:hypothetical protein
VQRRVRRAKPRRIRHIVQVIQHDQVANVHYVPPCISSLDWDSLRGVAKILS